MKKICLLVLLTVSALTICAQKKFVLTSPDGVLKAYISIGKEITYSVTHGTDTVLFQSAIAMQLDKGRTFGIASRLSGHNEKAVRQYLKSPFYKKKEKQVRCGGLTGHIMKKKLCQWGFPLDND